MTAYSALQQPGRGVTLFRSLAAPLVVMLVSLLMAMGAGGCGVGTGGSSPEALEDEAGNRPSPETLFLSWQDDPTNTMTIQWLEPGVPRPVVQGGVEDPPAFEVPRLEDVAIDGDVDDWGDHGLRLAFLPDGNGELAGGPNGFASARLAWNDEGLLVRIDVASDAFTEADAVDSLFLGDSVELFVSTGVGSPQRYQVIVAPGADPDQPEPRHFFFDRREDDAAGERELELELASSHASDGYALEVLLPWENLTMDAEPGAELAFQVQIGDENAAGESRVAAWYPDDESFRNPWARQPLRLLATDEPTPAVVRARAMIAERDYEAEAVTVLADARYAEQTVQLRAGERVLSETTLALDAGRAVGDLPLPPPPPERQWGTLEVAAGDASLAHVSVPGWMASRPPEAARVHYRRVNTGEREKVHTVRSQRQPLVDSPGLFVHRVHLTGLEPDADYAFGLLDHDGGEDRFRTAPATLDEPMTFLLAGDIDVGEDSVRVHQQAAKQEPLFTVIAGDLSYADGVDVDRKVQFLNEWSRYAITPEGYRIPMVVGIGNHEVIGGYGGDRRDAPFYYSLFDQLYPDRGYATMDFGDYLSFILLDSDHTTDIPGEQTAFLDQTLRERAAVPYVMPVYHIPAWPSVRDVDGRVNVLIREHWVPVFEEHGVDVVFETHDHAYKRTHRIHDEAVDEDRGVLYLGDGPWGAGLRTPATPEQRWFLKKTAEVHHFIRAEIDEDGRTFTAINDEGEVFDTYPETE